jgi:hypothetical protein
MSLFEKIKNKRYDLQEKKKYDPSDALRRAIGKQSELDAAKDFKKDVGKDITPEVKSDVKTKIDTSNRFFTDQPDSKTLKTKTTGDEGQFKSSKVKFDSGATGTTPSGSPDLGGTQKKFVKDRRKKLETGRTTYSKNKNLDKEISARRSAETTRADAINRAMGTSGSTEGAAGASGTTTKTKTVSQAEVSKRAQEFTKEINKKNKNRTFFDPEKAKEARKNLIAKRKEYGIDRKGNISDAGVERYAKKTKQLSSGSNVPAKITQADKDLAKTRMTNKYGRRLGRVRNKNMPSYDQIKRDIELRPYKDKLKRQLKFDKKKQRTIQKKLRIDKAVARSGESAIKFRDTARSVAKQIPGLTKTITTPAVANKAGKVLTPPKTKTALKPIVKKAITLTQKAGPTGAIVAGTGLALLNPSIRKTFKKVATAGLAAAGIKAASSQPKLVKRPPSKIGINLSPKA